MAQPVAAGLTRTAEEWPGEKFLPEDIGTLQSARRPDDHPFFGTSRARDSSPLVTLRAELSAQESSHRETKKVKANRAKARRRGQELLRQRARHQALQQAEAQDLPARLPKSRQSTLPEQVSYQIPVPQVLAHLPLAQARLALRRLHDANIARIQAERRARGEDTYLGAAAILAQNPTKAPRGPTERFKLNPRIAASTKAERLTLYEELSSWRHDHAEGVEALNSEAPWRARFPQGTHRRAQELRRLHLAHRDRGPPQAA